MMVRSQITLDAELQKRARKRAAQLGVSLAEYIRRLLVRDLGARRGVVNAASVFDLGDSGGSNVANEKDAMIGAAVARRKRRAGRRA
jgi:hypothetical protein